MSNKIILLSDESFEKNILKGKGFFLVDFWAEWCGPCKSIEHIIAEIADEFEGKLTIAKLNIDENPVIPSKYGIRSIPTLLLFRNGEAVVTKVGALSKGQLKAFITKNLGTVL